MRLVLDRIEKNQIGKKIAIFECEEQFFEFFEEDMPQNALNSISVGDIIEAQVENNKLNSFKVLKEETTNKQNDISSRLNSLFNRGKK